MHAVHEFIDFCDHIRAADDDECGSMTWVDTVREGRSLVLRLAVGHAIDDEPNQIWEVGSRHIREFSLAEFELTDWTLTDDHVLLWDHQEPFNQLNFRGKCQRREEVLWKLYERHRAIASPWIPFERYVNPTILANCLSTSCGVLADGPDRLLREYADVLEQHDCEPYFPYPPRPADRWDEESRSWIDQEETLSALILGGSSYIVGTDFFAIRIA